jgi:NhaP-type Na+/H+ or K+/H+ antiporter
MTNEYQARIETIGEQLRTKINSKFQTSTFLAGFAFTILGLQISLLRQSAKVPRLLFVSVSLMAVAIILFIKAILKLDVDNILSEDRLGLTPREIAKKSAHSGQSLQLLFARNGKNRFRPVPLGCRR